MYLTLGLLLFAAGKIAECGHVVERVGGEGTWDVAALRATVAAKGGDLSAAIGVIQDWAGGMEVDGGCGGGLEKLGRE